MITEPAKILYIEDDALSRLLVKKVLESSDGSFEFHEAANGLEGLRLADEISPDLILMDLRLPDFTGVELATKLRSNPRFATTVIVALTGRADENAREMSLVAGCDGYLTKPIEVDSFPGQISEFLEGKREQVDETRKDEYRRQYEETLVDHLSDKIEQLQEYNQLLNERSEKLRTYSNKLEILMHIVNDLQVCQSTAELKRMLVEGVVNKLHFDRCAFLKIDHDAMVLRVSHTRGFADEEWSDPEIAYDAPVFQKMFADKQMLFFPNPSSIPDSQASATLRQMGARQFLFGVLGVPAQQTPGFASNENIEDMVSSLIPSMIDPGDPEPDITLEHLQEYLLSDFFYLGGYLYADYKDRSRRIASYDIKILEMLLRTASLLYQNIRFREQLKELFVRAEKDAITDHLTNLSNYRSFTLQLNREFNRARRHETQFALLMLDIDFFKVYNDTLGHQAGDIALKKVAELLLANTRRSDFVARYGGEEFAIICPELSRDEGRRLAEKLCTIIAETPFPHEDRLPHRNVTISIGVAAYPNDSEDMQELVKLADTALYQAKENGRNRVQLYQGITL